MLRKRRGNGSVVIYRLFLVAMLAAVIFFVMRIASGKLETDFSAGQVMHLTQSYQMLKNCRFDTNLELPNSNPFIQYYQEAVKHTGDFGMLKMLSKNFERDMLYTHYCSVFHNIVQGKEVCSE